MGAKNRTKHAAVVCITMFAFGLSVFASNHQHEYLVAICLASTSAEGDQRTRTTYNPGERVQVKVLMTNISSKTANVPKGEDYTRPHLVREGQPIEYRKEVAARIGNLEKGGSSRITGFLFLKPNEPQFDVIDLDYWYGSLEPGHYQLNLQRVFFKQRVWSNTVFFEVLSPESSSDIAPPTSSNESIATAGSGKADWPLATPLTRSVN